MLLKWDQKIDEMMTELDNTLQLSPKKKIKVIFSLQ